MAEATPRHPRTLQRLLRHIDGMERVETRRDVTYFTAAETSHEPVFERRPGAMLDAFLIMQRQPELRGMSARTMRALLRNRRDLHPNVSQALAAFGSSDFALADAATAAERRSAARTRERRDA